MFTLDPLPERITDVERWQTAAGAIEAYRSRWDLDGTVAVGPEPAEPEQRAHRDRTVATVGAAGFLAPGESHAAGTEREALATRWGTSTSSTGNGTTTSVSSAPWSRHRSRPGRMSRISIGTPITGSACEVESLPRDNTSIK